MSSGTGFVMNVSHLKDITVPILITNHHVVEKAAATCCRFSESDEDANPIDAKTVKFTMPIDRADAFEKMCHNKMIDNT